MITFVTLSVPLNKKNNESIMACMNQRYRAAVSNNAKGLLDFLFNIYSNYYATHTRINTPYIIKMMAWLNCLFFWSSRLNNI